MKATQYRQEIYRLRSHPDNSRSLHGSDGESFSGVYFSLIPFLGLELFTEMALTEVPGGLVFPMGFFLFWAFYFTYYRPDHLESRVFSRRSLGFSGIPNLVLGGLIWIIKTLVVELGDLVLFRAWARPVPVPVRARPKAASTEPPKPPPPTPLPKEIINALSILGLPETRDWNAIHRRYRELAKRYHPDLNPDLSVAGSRFMTYDAAFKRLSAFKGRFFSNRAA